MMFTCKGNEARKKVLFVLKPTYYLLGSYLVWFSPSLLIRFNFGSYTVKVHGRIKGDRKSPP